MRRTCKRLWKLFFFDSTQFFIFLGPTLYSYFDFHISSSLSLPSRCCLPCCPGLELRTPEVVDLDSRAAVPRLPSIPAPHPDSTERRSPTPQNGAPWRLHRRVRPGRPGLGPPPLIARTPRSGIPGVGRPPANGPTLTAASSTRRAVPRGLNIWHHNHEAAQARHRRGGPLPHGQT